MRPVQNRDFGRLDFRPSALGFGAMRLPVLRGAGGKPDFKHIDCPLATAMLHRAIEGGVSYVDTARMYHEDTCEAWLGVRPKDPARRWPRERNPISFTSYRYCMPCPQGVDFPGVCETCNDAHIYDDLPRRRRACQTFMDEPERADNCIA